MLFILHSVLPVILIAKVDYFFNRIVYVDPYTVHLTGEQVPHGNERNGHPATSKYEERRKNKQKTYCKWREKFLASNMDREELELKTESVCSAIKREESIVVKLRKVVAMKRDAQTRVSNGLRKGVGSYETLCKAREELRAERKVLTPHEETLRQLRMELYHWNQMLKAAKSTEKSDLAEPSKDTIQKRQTFTTPTWSNHAAEDYTDFMDVSELSKNTQGGQRVIVYAGTDYGICTMSQTVALTDGRIKGHINRYHVLSEGMGDHCDTSFPYLDVDPSSTMPLSREEALKKLKLPKSHKVTAPQINSITHTNIIANRRNRALNQQCNRIVRDALGEISKVDNSLTTATTMGRIDSAHSARKDVKDILRGFESRKSRLKDLHRQRLRSKRAWMKLGASERQYVQDHALRDTQECK